jgi:beta-glucosidase
VLLKNKDHILPLNRKTLERIVVWGPMASPAVAGGGGSAYVHPILNPPVSMLDAIRQAAGPKVKVQFLGDPATAQTAIFNPVATRKDQRAIANASLVVACVGFGPQHEGEGIDRGYHLWGLQDRILQHVAKLNPHTIVVVNAGAGIGMASWIHKVAGLVYAWYPGENGNTAVAGIMFGKIDPSGRLPDTFSRHWRDEPAYGHFPAVNNVIDFTSGIYTGYRWYNKKHIQPLYPFGFGLSYTTFAMHHLQVTSTGTGKHRTYEVTAQVTNTGNMAGAEVAQLYIHPLVDRKNRCVQTLKGFARVNLQPGQSKTVRMKLDWRNFAYYDTANHDWQVPPGKYEIAVGSSSADEPLHKIVRW